MLGLAIGLMAQSTQAIVEEATKAQRFVSAKAQEQDAADNQAKIDEFYEKLACKELCAECEAKLLARKVVAAKKKLELAKLQAEAKAAGEKLYPIGSEGFDPNEAIRRRHYFVRGKKAQEFFEQNRKWLES